MTKRLRIAIATAGRFHLLDLARELHAQGHEVRFYSYVPRGRAVQFGLPAECHVPLLPMIAPVVAWHHLAPRLLPGLRERLFYEALDHAVVLRLSPCDVFVCMSGMYLEAIRHAKRRFGAHVQLHRGSRHILSQDEILAAVPGADRPSPLTIRRELAGYALADRIAIPSSHVEESFNRDPAALAKTVRNPYGVDISRFPTAPSRPVNDPVTLIFTGGWSLRKGCDLLQAAVEGLDGVRLLHIGPIIDLEFPKDASKFEHLGTVPQWRLPEFYAKADAFVHASREEGLSNVITQALASGLPVICTDRTGGADLAHTPALAARIQVTPHDDVVALAGAIAGLRDRLRAGELAPPLSQTDRETLTWSAYARRYIDNLARDMDRK